MEYRTIRPSFTDRVQSTEKSTDNLRDDSIGEPLWHIFPGDTKLTDLSPANNPPRLFSAYSDPRPEALSKGLWKMNGSQVKIAIANGSWTISIEQPNPALQRAGVRRGTVVFRGTQNGEMVSGTAFAFSANCQPVPVTTSGKISNNRVFELRGVRPSSPGLCGVPTQNVISLKFTFEPDRMMI
jgi:hypothetical protein